jgi:hypothetical protein
MNSLMPHCIYCPSLCTCRPRRGVRSGTRGASPEPDPPRPAPRTAVRRHTSTANLPITTQINKLKIMQNIGDSYNLGVCYRIFLHVDRSINNTQAHGPFFNRSISQKVFNYLLVIFVILTAFLKITQIL